MRAQHCHPVIFTLYKEPIMIVEGSMQYLFDDTGKRYLDLFAATGVEVIAPGCGACIGCGPGVSENADQVTVSAINRNFKGRSGPGRLYLASPYTVAASALAGRITAWNAKT